VDGFSYASNANEIIRKSKGGILFIDEAAGLLRSHPEAGNGSHAINALVDAIEEGGLVVIFTGYPESIERLLQAYPKLRSRFSHYIHFDDYDPSQMVLIFERLCEDHGYQMTAQARSDLTSRFEIMHGHRNLTFANASDVRKAFDHVVANHANRVMHGGLNGDNVSTIDVADLTGDRHESDFGAFPTTRI
jgi:hypothetical protein